MRWWAGVAILALSKPVKTAFRSTCKVIVFFLLFAVFMKEILPQR
jgi:hypothetical protein